MKQTSILLLALLAFSLSFTCCQDNNGDDNTSESGFPYPDGITRIGQKDQTDCKLDRCDPNRKPILRAIDAIGYLVTDSSAFKTYLSCEIPGSFDLYLTGFCCNIPSDYTYRGKVKFSGVYRDGCGKVLPSFADEEIYILHLTQIDSI